MIHLMSKTPCQVKMVSSEGKIYIFNSLLLNKKIPVISLEYPKDIKEFSSENLKKVNTSIWTSILKENNEEVGNGTVIEMSILGCRLMTDYMAKAGGTMFLSMMYSDDESVPPLKAKVVVKSSTPAPYETTYYNLDFCELSDETKNKVQKIIDTPAA
jgi:hypothetical protein